MYQRAMHFLLTSARRWLEKPAALNHDAMSTELERACCCKEVIVLKAWPDRTVRTAFFLAKSNYGVASSSCARAHACHNRRSVAFGKLAVICHRHNQAAAQLELSRAEIENH